MKFFEELGAAVLSRWRAKSFRYSVFPEIAYLAFREHQKDFHYRDIIRWALKTDTIPEQDATSEFGQPPVTLYRSSLFYIEGLFWLDGTTSIHQHSFSGAFQLLAGSSIHSQYSFRPREELSSRFVLGDLRLQKTEYLTKGDTRPILPGNQFIHSLFHLDFPSVTLVIRTYHEAAFAPQYDYRAPFLAFDPHALSPLMKRRSQLLHTLQKTSTRQRYFREIMRLIADADFEMAYLLMSHCYPILMKEQFESVVEAAKKKHGSIMDLLLPVLNEEIRQNHLISLRKPIKNAEHRFFLALLLNLRDRKSIFEFIRKKYGGDPVLRIEKWMKELTAPKSSLNGANPLGIEWNETADEMMHHMLTGLSFPAILKKLQDEYSKEEVQKQKRQLYELYSAFRVSIFRSLFQTTHKPPVLSKTKGFP